jgi:2-polyprenyl-6-methoxyphenol hydroxylase-like FAD-dependent oxidoreductase
MPARVPLSSKAGEIEVPRANLAAIPAGAPPSCRNAPAGPATSTSARSAASPCRPGHGGRVALLGDAAAAVSLLGDGSSLAIAGAHRLAAELAGADPDVALRRYEAGHRRLTDPKRRAARFAAAALVPSTRLGITARNTAARLFMSRAA